MRGFFIIANIRIFIQIVMLNLIQHLANTKLTMKIHNQHLAHVIAKE